MSEAVFSIPVTPDAEELLGVIRRARSPRRVHHIELFLDPEVKEAVYRRFRLDEGLDPAAPYFELRKEIRIHEFLGYDVFRLPIVRKSFFQIRELQVADTTSRDLSRGEREWMEEHRGPIQDWGDFERYAWPEVSDIDLRPLEWMEANLPENMGIYDLTAHVLELVTFLLGYETLCYKMFEDPQLVEAIAARIGEFYVGYTRILSDFRRVALIWGSDDMGFRTSLMVSPEFLRKTILPWHKACAEAGKAKGKPYLLHACGQLGEIMEDLIEEVRIEAKHSFEDSILPVPEAFRRYGSRIAILGGIDVDFLCRSGEPAIRRRVRETLDTCFLPAGGKGYCLGTGNTVANYIPVDHYLAMLDEGRRYAG